MAKTTPALTLSDFKSEAKRPGSKCWFQKELTDEQRKVVVGAVAGGASYSQISRTLTKKLGASIQASAVGHHFRGDCLCGR